MVCDELRLMARRYLHHEAEDPLLQPTVLIDQFFERLLKRRKVSWKNRRHFFGFAGQTMRQILVDQARRRNRQKRGDGERPIALGHALEQLPSPAPSTDILALHEVLEQLEASDPRAAEVVKLRSRSCKMKGIAEVDGRLVAQADIMSALVDRGESP